MQPDHLALMALISTTCRRLFPITILNQKITMKTQIKFTAVTLLLAIFSALRSTCLATTTIAAANRQAYAANDGWLNCIGDGNWWITSIWPYPDGTTPALTVTTPMTFSACVLTHR